MVLKENLYTMTLIKKIIKKINQRKIDCISVPKKKKNCGYAYTCTGWSVLIVPPSDSLITIYRKKSVNTKVLVFCM